MKHISLDRTFLVGLAFCAFALFHSANLSAADTITLNMQRYADRYTINDNGYWDKTYSTAEQYKHLDYGMFSFTHVIGGFGGEDVGGGMSYWDGFIPCNSSDTADYGVFGSSDGWVSQQWGCMAGGGLDSTAFPTIASLTNPLFQPKATKGVPYLVAYWGYYYETEGIHSCQVDFTDGKEHKPLGVWICNHPWPYYGNIHGDGFARPFDNGDRFTLTAHGLNSDGEDTGAEATLLLAEYKDDSLRQSPQWQYFDLTPLGHVNGIYFTMFTTDADPKYGANTAVYFCMDKLSVLAYEDSNRPARPSQLTTSDVLENSLVLSWAKQADAATYNIYLDNQLLGNTADASYKVDNLQPTVEYRLSVEAVGSDGTLSDRATITAITGDMTAPTTPTNLRLVEALPYSLIVEWEPSTDNVAVERYEVYLDGTIYARPKQTKLQLTGLDPDTEYTIEVAARDAAKNTSERIRLVCRTAATTRVETHINASPTAPYKILKDNQILIILPNGKTINLLGTEI